MDTYIFIGPTMSHHEAQESLDAVCLPPAKQGDVFLVARTRPRAIGIVDGFFESVPAVWHKEILWALAHGVDVFGSSSMGALRAAELSEFGMKGVGRIFEWYRDGVIEDDDEVALVHGPADSGYMPLSEPMINIRVTLAHAVERGIVSPKTAAALTASAKELHYSERTYAAVLARGRAGGSSAEDLIELERWLPAGRIDQKRLDAGELLAAMREWLATPHSRKQVTFHFERTVFWQRLERSVGFARIEQSAEARLTPKALLDELRLDPLSFARARNAIVFRELALAEAEREGTGASDDQIEHALGKFRTWHHLTGDADLERWLRENLLSRAELEALMREEVILGDARRRLLLSALRRLPDHLRLTGNFARSVSRAVRKQATLAAHGFERPTAEDVGMTFEEIVEEYLKDVRPPGASDDTAEYRAALYEVFDDLPRLLHAALLEVCYRQLAPLSGDETSVFDVGEQANAANDALDAQ